MRTPPLRRRIMVLGVLVLSAVLVAFDVFVYLSLRDGLDGALRELLAARVQVAANLEAELDPPDLAERLSALGVPAEVRAPDGELHIADPATPRMGTSGPPTALARPRVQRTVRLTDGTVLTVFATRAGVVSTLRRLLTVLVVGTIGAVLFAAVLWRRASGEVLAPLEQVAETAERISAGEVTRRLHPDRPDTELGRVATAFDDMVDTQVAALRTAEDERERTRRFLADAAHQLRTPMAGVRASAEQLLQEEDPRIRDRLLANVVRETARASRLVTALLRMVRLESEHVRTAPTDLVDVCEQEAERARSLAPHLDVEVVIERPPDGLVDVDADALHDALANLIDNARRHARSRVRIALTAANGAAAIQVSDDGPGIPPQDVDRVFERFASLDGRGGSGLGLPIARGVARAHGGDLTYEEGAFVLRVPVGRDR